MNPFRILTMVSMVVVAGACTGGDMGNTRGGGAAPGQSGGRDTTGAGANSAAPSASTVGASAAATRAGVDTTKQHGNGPAKQP
jgi:hypothetical protein